MNSVKERLTLGLWAWSLPERFLINGWVAAHEIENTPYYSEY